MKAINVYVMGLLYIYLGLKHFTNIDFYYQFMPNFVPFHKELIIASGFAEIILGFGIFFKRFRNVCLWGIILMLIVFMTVHLNMLVPANSLGNSLFLLIFRILLQFGLIYWAWRNIN